MLFEVNWPHNFNNCNHHSFLVVTTARPSRTPLSLLRPEPSIERKSAPEVSFLNFVIIRTNVVSDPIFYIFFFKQTCFPVFFKLDIFIKILFPSPSLCFVIVKNCRIFSYSFLKVPNFSLITQTIDIFNKESLVSVVHHSRAEPCQNIPLQVLVTAAFSLSRRQLDTSSGLDERRPWSYLQTRRE